MNSKAIVSIDVASADFSELKTQAGRVKELEAAGRPSCTNRSLVNLIPQLLRDGAGKTTGDLGHTDSSTCESERRPQEIYNR